MRRVLAAYGAALLAAAVLFQLSPSIDLWASGLFYRAGDGFYLSRWWPVQAIYLGVPYVTDAVVIGVPALYLFSTLRGVVFWRIDGRTAAFLLLALGLGPGLLVNAVLKDHWGRARPAQISEFGGTQHFTPAPLPADQCARNCSFPAGHPAIGFYLVSFALLVREPGRRRVAVAASVAAGALVGFGRMAQGGHFLSDVIFSGLLVSLTSWLLYRAIIVDDWIGVRLADRRPQPRLALAGLGLLLVTLLSMAFIDRPLARFFHGSSEGLRDVFQFITQFGVGKGYIIIAAALFVGLRLAAFVARSGHLAGRLTLNAHRALFVLLSVVIPGIAVDLVKVVFGRARPKLLFIDGTYGFSWGATQADHWSFPSGHATTIVALATALTLLWPRFFPAYALAALLVSASRVIIGAHYLSDVMAGAAAGVAITWMIWLAYSRVGISLASPPVSLPSERGGPVRSLER